VNALEIVVEDPAYFDLVGVAWLTDTVLNVDEVRFARLLAVRTSDGSLFHKQANFPWHGFAEICHADARKMLSPRELEGVDIDVVRLVTHEAGEFCRGRIPDIEGSAGGMAQARKLFPRDGLRPKAIRAMWPVIGCTSWRTDSRIHRKLLSRRQRGISRNFSGGEENDAETTCPES
jgi:hypothetical protein